MSCKVLIVTPCYENIYPVTFKCIADALKYDYENDIEVYWDYVGGYSVDKARCECVTKAMKQDADYILFVDNDVTFKPEYIDHLIEHYEDVVMGYYRHRPQDRSDTLERTNLCKLGQESYIEQITPDEMMDARAEGYDLVQVKGGGLGFCLIAMDVFEILPRPYFLFVNYWTGHALSEDLFFCEQCAKAGIEIYADTRCYCGHVFRQVTGGFDD